MLLQQLGVVGIHLIREGANARVESYVTSVLPQQYLDTEVLDIGQLQAARL